MGARHDRNMNAGSDGWDLSALPLSYPTIPVTNHNQAVIILLIYFYNHRIQCHLCR